MEFLYVRVSKRASGYNETTLTNKTKNTNIVKDYNILNKNCIIMDENLKHI